MTISGSLSNALSGLIAASRAAEVVSSNVANAMTEGYARRELDLSARSLAGIGTGVMVDGVSRVVDKVVLADRRLADASAAAADLHAGFYTRLEDSIGLPEEGASLSGRMAAFEAALADAAARPDSDTRLMTLVDTAGALTGQFNAISTDIQASRMEADAQIAAQVDLLNDRLAKVADLNASIRNYQGQGQDTAALMDQRQAIVDDIAQVLPLRVIERDHGQIAIYTQAGAALIDGRPSTFSFQQTAMIVPEMSIGTGALSGLHLNGQPIGTTGAYSPIAGGSLSALFEQRDDLAPAAQAELDALARDLIDRFQNSGIDPSLLPGNAGLFTDGGAVFVAADEIGVAGRLSLNALVNPSQGGAPWRLRDGLGAAAPGPAGNNGLLLAMSDALAQTRVPASGQFTGVARSASALGAEFLSWISSTRQSREADQSFALAKADTLKSAELADGVDTDAEMQTLLVIERAYAANARVIKAVEDLLQSLLSI
ncbi:flagellar hook-associated protein FlgK [Actibacterium sp. XHP0104]|uniref:flagellar hook-associated protein FlgK n=1 Tax=Actibacterium sp. XHP0104 TaxID=2984335 RepID=UPI0021E8BB02|nr:flagellar hook-associated protein FlgK [Actibacterium sp. XHP0104]MCV2881824.1 flagellar hook-associated protein FlgK [Actibacterium sp. XHP0104]